jgi:hypothetical protein
MDDHNRFRITPRLILGLFIAFAGTLLLLDNLGMIEARDARHFFRFWPVAVILFGLSRVQPSRWGGRSDGRGFGFILIFVGTWLLLANLGVAHVSTDLLWPGVILLLGLNLLYREVFRRRRVPPSADAADHMDATAILGSVKRVSASQSFRGGDATAVLGSCEIDLRQSLLAEQGAEIDVFTMFGGVEVIVPDDWEIVLDGTAILGAFEDQTRQIPGPRTRRLVIRGLAVMGGVEVKNRTKKD